MWFDQEKRRGIENSPATTKKGRIKGTRTSSHERKDKPKPKPLPRSHYKTYWPLTPGQRQSELLMKKTYQDLVREGTILETFPVLRAGHQLCSQAITPKISLNILNHMYGTTCIKQEVCFCKQAPYQRKKKGQRCVCHIQLMHHLQQRMVEF